MSKFLTLGIMLTSIGAFANGLTSNPGDEDKYCEIQLLDGTRIICQNCATSCEELKKIIFGIGRRNDGYPPANYQPPKIEKPSMEGGISGL